MNQFNKVPDHVTEQGASVNPHLRGFERFTIDQRNRIADLLTTYREKWDLLDVPINRVVQGLEELVGQIGEVDRFASVDQVIAALREKS